MFSACINLTKKKKVICLVTYPNLFWRFSDCSKNFYSEIEMQVHVCSGVRRASERSRATRGPSFPPSPPPHSDQWTDNETNVEGESSQSYASVPSPSNASRIHSTPTLALDSIQAEENSETSVLIAFFSSRLCPLDDIRTG